jgi:hypothetical protein
VNGFASEAFSEEKLDCEPLLEPFHLPSFNVILQI